MATYYHPGIAEHLAAQGLQFEVIRGWETRGVRNLRTGARMPFNPRGALSHWTAGPRTGERPSLSVCLNGRPGIPGPLCNVFLGRQSIVLIAAGRANHAGAGSIAGLTSASQLWGTEGEDSGRNEWTDFQRWAYPRINAAYSTYSGFDERMHFSHAEYATPRGRKVDINGYTMDDMRRQIRAILDGKSLPPGSTSDRSDVEIQLALAVLGLYDAGANARYIDGKNGSHQQAAVRLYQQKYGLQVDGWWGPATNRHFEEKVMASILDDIARAVASFDNNGKENQSLWTKIKDIQSDVKSKPSIGEIRDGQGFHAGKVDAANQRNLAPISAKIDALAQVVAQGTGIDIPALLVDVEEAARKGSHDGVLAAEEDLRLIITEAIGETGGAHDPDALASAILAKAGARLQKD